MTEKKMNGFLMIERQGNMACKYNDSVTCNRKIWKCEECSIEKCVKAVKENVVEQLNEKLPMYASEWRKEMNDIVKVGGE